MQRIPLVVNLHSFYFFCCAKLNWYFSKRMDVVWCGYLRKYPMWVKHLFSNLCYSHCKFTLNIHQVLFKISNLSVTNIESFFLPIPSVGLFFWQPSMVYFSYYTPFGVNQILKRLVYSICDICRVDFNYLVFCNHNFINLLKFNQSIHSKINLAFL